MWLVQTIFSERADSPPGLQRAVKIPDRFVFSFGAWGEGEGGGGGGGGISQKGGNQNAFLLLAVKGDS